MSSKPESLVERMKLLLSSGDGADVHFLVGDGDEKEDISAHKVILNSASDVFEAMFRFDSQNTSAEALLTATEQKGAVEVPDIDAKVFKVMLGFIYADDLVGLNGENAMALLYAAKKYNIVGLVKACVSFPISKLCNVFLAYAQARLLDENDFACRCLDYIDQNAETLLKSEAFLEIDQILICEILARDQLKTSGELVIWNASLRWADAQCEQNAIECSPKNRRQVLGLALFNIRFPLISQANFAEHIVPSGLLTSAELDSIFLYHSHSDNRAAFSELRPFQFSKKKRTPFFSVYALPSFPLDALSRWPSLSFSSGGGCCNYLQRYNIGGSSGGGCCNYSQRYNNGSGR